MREPSLVRAMTGIILLLGSAGTSGWVSNQPGCNGWDGMIWPWYVGRYIAAHFTMLTYP